MLLNINLAEAQEILLAKVVSLPAENVGIMNAAGRILYDDLYTREALPSRAGAARDGFAVHMNDLTGGKNLLVKTSLPLGQVALQPLQAGETVEVITGGAIPDNTAAVVPYEDVQIRGMEIYFEHTIKAGSFIKVAGEDFQAGELCARQGSRITPGLISLMAATGSIKLRVYSRPRIAILSLGNQMIPCSSEPGPGQMRDSNGPLLASLGQRDGGEIIAVETAADRNPDSLKESVLGLMEEADLLLTIGGTYARGEEEARLFSEDIGGELLFWGVPMQPGGHNGAAVRKNGILISLSGNPAACAVGYELLVAPVIRAMQGIKPYPLRINAECLDNIPGKGGERRFVRGYAGYDGSGWKVKVLPGQKPGMVRSLLKYNALIDLPAESPAIKAGTMVELILLDTANLDLENI